MVNQYSEAQAAASFFLDWFLFGDCWDAVLIYAEDHPGDKRLLDLERFTSAQERLNVPQGQRGAGRLTSVTDWLQFWLLTGQGVAATNGKYSRYLETVAISFATIALNLPGDEDLPLFPKEIGAGQPHNPGEMEDLRTPTTRAYVMPVAISRDFYQFAAKLKPNARAEVLANFLANPNENRRRCA